MVNAYGSVSVIKLTPGNFQTDAESRTPFNKGIDISKNNC